MAKPHFRIVTLPDSVEHIVVGIFGIQTTTDSDGVTLLQRLNPATWFVQEANSNSSGDDGEATSATKVFEDLLNSPDLPAKPVLVEAAHNEKTSEPIYVVYWPSSEAYELWLQSPRVAQFWREFLGDGKYKNLGVFREISRIHRSRFDHAGSTEFLTLAKQYGTEPSDIQGWGAFRKRIAASKTDKLESPLEVFPTKVEQDAKGRCLSVSVPDNVLLLKEPQVLDLCDPSEAESFNTMVRPALNGWLDYLDSEPAAAGSLHVHRLVERPFGPTAADGEPSSMDRTFQMAYYLSLGHAEKTAMRAASHTKLRHAFYKDFRAKDEGAARPNPVQLWSGVYILESGGFDSLYINCRRDTGLLKWFEARAVDLAAPAPPFAQA
ncbi:hypothetical protein DL93DRAFT_38259 [Clavulina sp. PMI_390]|nr:hypothetical protein DL93DRAFT_38259 [Clavulina sp. PMI_390]